MGISLSQGRYIYTLKKFIYLIYKTPRYGRENDCGLADYINDRSLWRSTYSDDLSYSYSEFRNAALPFSVN